MGETVFFPGVEAAVSEDEPEIDLEELCARQSDLLARWVEIGTELKRRAETPLPIGIEIDLDDLIVESRL